MNQIPWLHSAISRAMFYVAACLLLLSGYYQSVGAGVIQQPLEQLYSAPEAQVRRFDATAATGGQPLAPSLMNIQRVDSALQTEASPREITSTSSLTEDTATKKQIENKESRRNNDVIQKQDEEEEEEYDEDEMGDAAAAVGAEVGAEVGEEAAVGGEGNGEIEPHEEPNTEGTDKLAMIGMTKEKLEEANRADAAAGVDKEQIPEKDKNKEPKYDYQLQIDKLGLGGGHGGGHGGGGGAGMPKIHDQFFQKQLNTLQNVAGHLKRVNAKYLLRKLKNALKQMKFWESVNETIKKQKSGANIADEEPHHPRHHHGHHRGGRRGRWGPRRFRHRHHGYGRGRFGRRHHRPFGRQGPGGMGPSGRWFGPREGGDFDYSYYF